MPRSPLADVVVANIHRRYTGVSATVRALMPHLRAQRQVDLFDTGCLQLGGEISFLTLLRWGWTQPSQGRYRIWHARRDLEILLGLFLRSVLRQPWKVVFTSAAPRRHGPVLRWIINCSDAIIATSAKAATFLDWHTVVIHHGVDTNWFCPPKEPREQRLQRSGLVGESEPLVETKSQVTHAARIWPSYAIGQFGRIRYSKGTDLFIHALIQLLPKHLEFMAVISGLCQTEDQAYLDVLKGDIEKAGLTNRIVFLGDLTPEAIRDWYQTVSLVVAASRSEGFGLTPLEAFASGCTVVASHAGIWPEVVDEQVGSLFQTGDLHDLIEKLRPYLEEPSLILQKADWAQDRASKKHSIAFEAQGVLKVYDAVQQ
jgi:mannosyltransferase